MFSKLLAGAFAPAEACHPDDEHEAQHLHAGSCPQPVNDEREPAIEPMSSHTAHAVPVDTYAPLCRSPVRSCALQPVHRQVVAVCVVISQGKFHDDPCPPLGRHAATRTPALGIVTTGIVSTSTVRPAAVPVIAPVSRLPGYPPGGMVRHTGCQGRIRRLLTKGGQTCGRRAGRMALFGVEVAAAERGQAECCESGGDCGEDEHRWPGEWVEWCSADVFEWGDVVRPLW
jgi:hypothetical protein